MNSSSRIKKGPETAPKTRKPASKNPKKKSPAQTSTSLAETRPKPPQRRRRKTKKDRPKSGVVYKNACLQEFADPFKILSANFSYSELRGDEDEVEDETSDDEKSEKSYEEKPVPVKDSKPLAKKTKTKRKKNKPKKAVEEEISKDFLFVGGEFENASIISIKEPCELLESEEDDSAEKEIEDGVIKSSLKLMPGLTRPIARKEGCLDISKQKIIHPISSIWKKTAPVEKKKAPKKKKTKRTTKKKKPGPGGDRRVAATKKPKPPTKKLRCKKTRIVK